MSIVNTNKIYKQNIIKKDNSTFLLLSKKDIKNKIYNTNDICKINGAECLLIDHKLNTKSEPFIPSNIPALKKVKTKNTNNHNINELLTHNTSTIINSIKALVEHDKLIKQNIKDIPIKQVKEEPFGMKLFLEILDKITQETITKLKETAYVDFVFSENDICLGYWDISKQYSEVTFTVNFNINKLLNADESNLRYNNIDYCTINSIINDSVVKISNLIQSLYKDNDSVMTSFGDIEYINSESFKSESFELGTTPRITRNVNGINMKLVNFSFIIKCDDYKDIISWI